MLRFVIAILLVELCASQSCQNDLAGYMQCIKSNLDRDYNGFETEFREDFKKLTRQCFASNLDDARDREVCTLFDNELEADAFGPDGPLRQCQICQKVAQFLKGALLSLSEQEATCFRRKINDAIKRNNEPCIRRRLGDQSFRAPDLPDFDEKGLPFRAQILQTTSYGINANSRLEFCKPRAQRYSNTQSCLKNPFAGYLPKHCTALNDCRSRVTAQCKQQFDKVEKATCDCVEEKRQEIKERVSNIKDVIVETLNGRSSRPIVGNGGCSSPACQCAQQIAQQLRTDEVDFKQVLQESMDECLAKPPPLTVDKMLDIGCRRAATLDASGMQDLTIGFNFIQNTVDALVERVARFCRGGTCPL